MPSVDKFGIKQKFVSVALVGAVLLPASPPRPQSYPGWAFF